MSVQQTEGSFDRIFCIEVTSSLTTRPEAILHQLPGIGIAQDLHLETRDLYFIQGKLPPQDIQRLAALICDPVTDHYHWHNLKDRVAPIKGELVVEVALRPGVTDNAATQLRRAAKQAGIAGLKAVATGQSYRFEGHLAEAELHRIARSLLVNDTIQRYTLGVIEPEFVQRDQNGTGVPATPEPPEIIQIAGLDSNGLMAVSRERRLALDETEMRAVQAYFDRQGRAPTDAELETLAQTWSEHCVHKTFKARIRMSGEGEIDGLLRTTIMAATRQIDAPWVLSAFVDNAGVIAFDEENDLSFKVETHNHPSAIEPFGGANTGVGG
ncbi:MAG: phosphoribosylformylglycinamidine synthase, partial [Chloroflexota bacterium]